MRVLHRRAFAHAAREEQLHAYVARGEPVQLNRDLDRHRLAELDARAWRVEAARGNADPRRANLCLP
jgi:hypothetical protein